MIIILLDLISISLYDNVTEFGVQVCLFYFEFLISLLTFLLTHIQDIDHSSFAMI